MEKKKFNVYDGTTRIASDMELDVALCLIKGYLETYSNDKIDIGIQQTKTTTFSNPPA